MKAFKPGSGNGGIRFASQKEHIKTVLRMVRRGTGNGQRFSKNFTKYFAYFETGVEMKKVIIYVY